MRRRRTLVTSPLEWQMTAFPVAPPALPVVAERGGTQLRAPRPAIIVDTREMGEEVVASYLYEVFLYHWLESNDHGRFLADNDL